MPQGSIKYAVMLRPADAYAFPLYAHMDTSFAHFIYQFPQHDYLITRELLILPTPEALIAATEYVSYSTGIVNRPHAEGASRGLGLRHESAQGLTTVVPISAESSMQASGGTPYSCFCKIWQWMPLVQRPLPTELLWRNCGRTGRTSR